MQVTIDIPQKFVDRTIASFKEITGCEPTHEQLVEIFKSDVESLYEIKFDESLVRDVALSLFG